MCLNTKTANMKITFTSVLILNFCLSLSLRAQTDKKEITLEDIFQSFEFYPEYIHGLTSMNDGETYSMIKNDSLNNYSYKTGDYISTIVTSQQLIPEGDSTPISMRNYTLSPDEDKIIFETKSEYIYRHSKKSSYYYYELTSGKLKALSSKGKQQLATFSPNGNNIAFVRENNLFISDLINQKEIQITTDGKYNNIINGSADWVYEEEFGFTMAFFWSPNGKKIAYYKFDESKVKEFQMTTWGELYPEPYKYKYPKAGESNSIIEILVYDLESQKTISMDIGEETDIYIPRIKWTNEPDKLSIIWMNRLQNELKIFIADANIGNTRMIYHETNKYYIDITDDLTFLNNKDQFIISSEKNGYNHLYLYSLEGEFLNQITSGSWEVSDLIGINEEKELLYFTSTEISPLNRDLYYIKLDGSKKTKLSKEDGTNSIQFSKEYKYFINSYSNANQPPKVTINNAKGKELRILEDNDRLVNTISEFNFSEKEFFSFKTSENAELNGWMIKPLDFDPLKKYPVLMYVYGGPGSQTVRNSWGYRDAWYHMLAAKGIIIVSVDNRGTGSRGEEFKKMTYQQLGKFETIDQIEAAKYLASLEYVNQDKIGIWGWSYGGYMSSLCITKGSDIFNMAIAVAPVTNWRYYDNIYTERFMRTPQENPEGYDDNSPIFHVDKLKGSYLIIHGTSDDNVHAQNTIDMISALIVANKQFEMQLYPNSNHGIFTGKNTTIHLYQMMTDFIYENLLDNNSK